MPFDDGPFALRGHLMRAALLAAALLVTVSASPSGSTADARPLVTGITGISDDATGSDPATMDAVKKAGAGMVHAWLRWNSIAPASRPGSWRPEDPTDPHYDWSASDKWVNAVVAAGLTPVLGVYGSPRWAEGCQAPNVPCDPNPKMLAAFAKAAALRYGGGYGLPHVRYWQAWNEPNLSLFFAPLYENGKLVAPGLYRTMLNEFYAAVKSVHGSNLVLAAGLGPIAVPRYTIGPLRFTRELLCMTGRRNPKPTKQKDCRTSFDIFDIHPYTTGGPLHEGKPDDVQLGDLEDLQELLHAADRAGRIKGRFNSGATWITEFSWDSKPPDPGGLQMRILTRWAAMAMYRSWSAGISHFFWFSLRDYATGFSSTFEETVQSGLYFRGESLEKDRPKPVLAAFRFPFVAIPEDGGVISFWGRTPTSQAGRVLIEAKRPGGWKNVVGVSAARTGVFKGRIAAAAARGLEGPFRASFQTETSPAFSLKEVKDFYQPPFG